MWSPYNILLKADELKTSTKTDARVSRLYNVAHRQVLLTKLLQNS